MRAAASASLLAGLIFLKSFGFRLPAGRTAHSRSRTWVCSSVPAGRRGLYAVLGVFGTEMTAMKLAQVEFRRIGAHVVKCQQIEKRFSRLLPRRSIVELPEEKRRSGRGNRRVLEDPAGADHGPTRYPRRDENRRHADAQPIEQKRFAGFGRLRRRDEQIRRARRRRHVIVDPAV